MSVGKIVKFSGTIQPWGNSLGLRITRPIGELANLVKGSQVEIEVTNDGLIVKAKPTKHKLPFTEAELIKGLTPAMAHADELPSPLSGEFGD